MVRKYDSATPLSPSSCGGLFLEYVTEALLFCCFLLQHLPLTQGQGNGNGNMEFEVGGTKGSVGTCCVALYVGAGGVSLGYMPVITIHRGTHSASGCVCVGRGGLSQVLLRVCKSAMTKEEKVEKGEEELGHRCQSSWRLCSPLSYADCLCHVRQREKKKEGERERGKILAHLSWSNNKIMS